MKKTTRMGQGFQAYRSPAVLKLERRLFLRQGLSLGALALLTGCDVTEEENVQKALSAMSRWNDGVQSAIFSPTRLAPEFPESMLTTPFPFNAFYGENEIPQVDANDYTLELSGIEL